MRRARGHAHGSKARARADARLQAEIERSMRRLTAGRLKLRFARGFTAACVRLCLRHCPATPRAPPPGIEEFDEQVDIYLGATTQKEKIKEEAVLQVQIKKLMRVRDRA